MTVQRQTTLVAVACIPAVVAGVSTLHSIRDVARAFALCESGRGGLERIVSRIPGSVMAGMAGAGALTLIHQGARSMTENAPRMDVLGMRAVRIPMQRASFRQVSAAVLGAGSIGFAVWALVAPREFAAFMGSDPSSARLTGARDLAIGGALLVRPDRLTFALRAAADAWDAATVSKSAVAQGAAAFSLWAATAAVSSAR